MQTVYLNGNIAQFGEVWKTNCKNIRDIFKLIDCQTPGFRKYLLDASEANVGFEIKRGSDFLEDDRDLLLSLKDEDIIITEVPSGSKSAKDKIFTAIAIVVALYVGLPGLDVSIAEIAAAGGTAAGTATTIYYTGMMIATNLAISGITQLLAPGPETDERQEGYIFNGPVNGVAQGLPVPVLYGELIVGGAPISASYFNNPPTSLNNRYGAYTYGMGQDIVTITYNDDDWVYNQDDPLNLGEFEYTWDFGSGIG